MTTISKTPRLLEAAKEFNIGKDTLVAFLIEKGFQVTASPATKLTEKMYNALQVEFAQDKAAKRKSDEIVLSKSSNSDNAKKHREEHEASSKEKRDTTIAPPENKLPVSNEPAKVNLATGIPAVPIVPDVKENGAKAVAKPTDKLPEAKVVPPTIPVIPVVQPVKTTSNAGAAVIPPSDKKIPDSVPVKADTHTTPEVKITPAVVDVPLEPAATIKLPEIPKEVAKAESEPRPTVSVVAKDALVSEQQEVPPVAVAATHIPESKSETPAKETAPVATDISADSIAKGEKSEPAPEHLETKAPKLEGPNILGKINLDELNLASRPKKGTPAKKKPEGQITAKTEDKNDAAGPSEQENIVHEGVETADIETEVEHHAVPEPIIPEPIVPEPEVRTFAAEPEAKIDEPNKPEHIEFKGVKLDGPKIIGKIELPVASAQGSKSSGMSGSGGNRDEKRPRKRIPLDKKPEGTAGAPGATQGSAQPFNRDNNRPGQDNRGNFQRDNRDGNRDFNRNRQDAGGQRNFPAPAQGDRNRPANTGSVNPGQNQGGYQNRPDNRQGGFRPDNRAGGQRPDNRQQGGSPGQSQSPDDRRPFRVAQPQQPMPGAAGQVQQEIDTKAIQEKIRETQAKLSGATRGKTLKSKYRKTKRDEMAEKRAAAENAEQSNSIQVTEFISVSELANLLDVNFAEVIGKCMNLGIMVSINQRLDAEVIELVASEFGYVVEFINLEQEETEEEEIVDAEEDLVPRAPIVTIMGHVDHGKTSLLDYIRSANVVAGEAGGITQHIGAYQVTTSGGKKITFLDTPGHEAFTAMRARGAKVADVAVIVIAADDSIMPQTREAISHAQAGNLPMIFAINKIDKPGANPEKIKEALAKMNILVEDWGGKFQSQDISAKKGENVDLLLEKIGLEAELLELKANPDRIAAGSVIEASLDKGRGYQSTILVQNGKLHQGEMIVCGQYFGKIKAMFNERGQRVKEAGPSTPVQVLGLNGAPQAGEKFKVYRDENEAKEVANHRAQILREQGIRARKHITLDEIGRRLALGNFKELRVIIKGDFDGSVEALSDSLQKLSTQEVAVHIVHKAVGQITESDVLLATASDAIILGFQVRPSMQAAKLAEQENIEIRTYSIIYDAIDEIKSAMEGLLEPKVEKKTVSNIEVREVFKISGVGTVAGCYVLDGKMNRHTKLNLVRDGIVVFTGELGSLKRFKDDVKDVNAGYECGLTVKNYNDVRVGDIIEGYEEIEVKRTL
jgi:translation initiation factor IF-2